MVSLYKQTTHGTLLAMTSRPLMIRTVDLRVDYDTLTAVNHVNLEVPAGEIYGLIGPNGAGKSSTIRVLAMLQEPTYGEVYVGGHDVREAPREVQRLLGYMPDWAPVYEDLKLEEFLSMFAAAYGLPRDAQKARVDEVLALAQLSDRRSQKAGTLSRGLKQRLVLAKTLLHDPAVLLLDEPASGLDPKARIELRNMLKALVKLDKTVLISSHILTELEGFCTSIGIMSRGRLVKSGPIEEVIAELSPTRRFAVRVLGDTSTATALLEAAEPVATVAEVEPGLLHLVLEDAVDDAAVAALLASLVRAEVEVMTFSELKLNVEDVFMQISVAEAEEDAA